ncbi:Smad nuclear interacting protein 1 [Sarcoptes scabiei]|uniref:Smad nuclear interacting protein 1 n=1 Tax=Sarcoptes scabiei TaxID=52283 RepID=A0A834RD77_SARSC|nr:Smad nuclear interacting protein 1 [Sarcoptes scabiei]
MDDRKRKRYHEERSRNSTRYDRDPEDVRSLRHLKERARKELRHHQRRDSREHSRNERERVRSPIQRQSSTSNHKENGKFRFSRRRQDDSGSGPIISTEPIETKEKPPEIKPNFELTGALARDTNTFNGIVIKYNEPPEAMIPKTHWRLYPFKGREALEYIPIHKQSAYLLGRERKVADIPIDHPSCSKQHAVIQFRCITKKLPDETEKKVIRPYIIDLESANGTFVNGNQIEPKRFVELLEQDVIKFGFSSREYVLLHEHSAKDSDERPDDKE